MSSRSFRRRNNRRRHRQGAGDETPGQRPDGLQDEGQQQTQGQNPSGRQPGESPPPAAHGNPAPPAARTNPPPAARRAHAGRSQGGRAAEPQRPAEPTIPIVLPDCPVCGKQVRELASALTHRVARQPAHFDCVIRELRDSNEIAPQEKICYLGAGSFGILEFRPPGGPARFVIRKRIQYEEKETPQEWKKPLQVTC
jgi:hypothetical protein